MRGTMVKRMIAALAASAMLATFFTGCGNKDKGSVSNGEKTSVSTQTPSTTTTVTTTEATTEVETTTESTTTKKEETTQVTEQTSTEATTKTPEKKSTTGNTKSGSKTVQSSSNSCNDNSSKTVATVKNPTTTSTTTAATTTTTTVTEATTTTVEPTTTVETTEETTTESTTESTTTTTTETTTSTSTEESTSSTTTEPETTTTEEATTTETTTTEPVNTTTIIDPRTYDWGEFSDYASTYINENGTMNISLNLYDDTILHIADEALDIIGKSNADNLVVIGSVLIPSFEDTASAGKDITRSTYNVFVIDEGSVTHIANNRSDGKTMVDTYTFIPSGQYIPCEVYTVAGSSTINLSTETIKILLNDVNSADLISPTTSNKVEDDENPLRVIFYVNNEGNPIFTVLPIEAFEKYFKYCEFVDGSGKLHYVHYPNNNLNESCSIIENRDQSVMFELKLNYYVDFSDHSNDTSNYFYSDPTIRYTIVDETDGNGVIHHILRPVEDANTPSNPAEEADVNIDETKDPVSEDEPKDLVPTDEESETTNDNNPEANNDSESDEEKEDIDKKVEENAELEEVIDNSTTTD